MEELEKSFKYLDLEMDNEKQLDRLEHLSEYGDPQRSHESPITSNLHRLRSRGKGAPKKKKGPAGELMCHMFKSPIMLTMGCRSEVERKEIDTYAPGKMYHMPCISNDHDIIYPYLGSETLTTVLWVISLFLLLDRVQLRLQLRSRAGPEYNDVALCGTS